MKTAWTVEASSPLTFVPRKNYHGSDWRTLAVYWVKLDGRILGTVVKSMDSSKTGGSWAAINMRAKNSTGYATRTEAAEWLRPAAEPKTATVNARPRLYQRRYWVAQIGDMFIQDDMGLGDGVAKLHRSPDFAKDWGSEEAAQYAIDHYRHKVPMAELAMP